MTIPLTVALLTYNRPEYLKESIQGILNQTYTDFEFLILDNGSTDDTPYIILTNQDPRIRYIRNPPGSPAEFNGVSALKIARGRRIIITHDDDIMTPGMLERQMALMDADHDLLAVWTNTSTIDQNGAIIQEYFTPPSGDRIYRCGEYISSFPSERLWPLPSGMMFLRKSFPGKLLDDTYYKRDAKIDNIGKHTKGSHDVIIPAMFNTKGSVAFISEPLLKYRQHAPQETNRVNLSEPAVHLYATLKKLIKRTPLGESEAIVFDSHIARYKAQHEVISIEKLSLPLSKAKKLRALLARARQGAGTASEAYYPLLPLMIFLSQTDSDTEVHEMLDGITAPGIHHSRATHSLFQWAMSRKEGTNIFSSMDKPGNIVILGSVFISALLVAEAQEHGLNVLCCIDSNATRQNRKLLGVPINPPEWLRMHGKEVNFLIFSSEKDQEPYLEKFIRGYTTTRTLSWKYLANKSATSTISCMKPTTLPTTQGAAT